jgi:hypothetical protein
LSSMGSRAEDVRSQIQAALRSVLIDKVRQDHYPSATMMDAIEADIDDEQLREYAEVLIDKLESDQFPSIDLMKRLSALR